MTRRMTKVSVKAMSPLNTAAMMLPTRMMRFFPIRSPNTPAGNMKRTWMTPMTVNRAPMSQSERLSSFLP